MLYPDSVKVTTLPLDTMLIMVPGLESQVEGFDDFDVQADRTADRPLYGVPLVCNTN